MTKSELISRLSTCFPQQKNRMVELAVRLILMELESALVTGGRIEIRGFGSFSLHTRAARVGRNPKNGTLVDLAQKRVPHFKPGKALRERVDIYRQEACA